ncbi:uncharacterized protein L203_104151 [Cryptococcus depauperatus CBS 7841]|uniref:Uncharacterized protein n=1 Tax=Cryptococcus depauperatus CBS 7841 TaxID=1295531 RepID=A0AAJ8M2T4_9TREE
MRVKQHVRDCFAGGQNGVASIVDQVIDLAHTLHLRGDARLGLCHVQLDDASTGIFNLLYGRGRFALAANSANCYSLTSQISELPRTQETEF